MGATGALSAGLLYDGTGNTIGGYTTLDQSQQNQMQAQNQYLYPGPIQYYNSFYNNTTKTENKLTESGGPMKSFRDYLDKHRDLIFTVALAFIIDQYFLGGALKERIKKVLEGVLNKAETSIHKEISS